MAGDCFLVAARWVEAHPEWVLVHGLPRATAGRHAGHRYWHAWTELTREVRHPALAAPIVTTVVADRSNGLDVEMPRAMYYKIGDLDEETVWRYQADEAMALLYDRHEHYGPWVPGWEGMGR